jgi:hypothetical protein
VNDRILGRAFANEPHCMYCGLSLYKGRVCGDCNDLPALDDDYNARELRDWWLARYTLDEIRDLAQGIAA